MATHEARTIAVSIDRDREEVYDFAHRPESFPAWASGLGSDLRRDGEDWVARGPEGPVRVRFSPPNPFGVLDHAVTTADGAVVEIPLRVVANGTGSEILLTLFRIPGTSDEAFARDAEWVRRDLEALKALLERRPRPSSIPTRRRFPMGNPGRDRQIDNIEFAVSDIARARDFYGTVFGWRFTDYGPGYCEFTDGRLTGGLAKGEPAAPGGPLVILYADDLAETQRRLEEAGAEIVRPVFSFPGGRRFHFRDPEGYELAVWSDT